MPGKIELSVDISVEWQRSATWGMCPTATVSALLTEDGVAVRRDHGSGHASGCGYVVPVAAVAVAVVPWTSWPWPSRLSRRGRGVRRVPDVAASRPRPCGFCVAVWRLRHADGCQCLQWFWRGLC